MKLIAITIAAAVALSGCAQLSQDIQIGIAKTCGQLPTIRRGLGVAAWFEPADVAAGANLAAGELARLCASPPQTTVGLVTDIARSAVTIRAALARAQPAATRRGLSGAISGALGRMSAELHKWRKVFPEAAK